MDEKEKDYIIDLAFKYNPQLKEKDIPTPEFKREEYEKVCDAANQSKILLITGLRGIGKTTMMRQMLKEVLDDGIILLF